ncbi:TPA: hypothetical protein ACGO5T_001241 [Streptococcus suis]
MKFVKAILKTYWRISLFIIRLIAPLLNYIEKEIFRSLRAAGPSGSVPIDNDALNAAAAANAEENRRKMLETEKRARQAEERAKQTQHHQDQMRAAQARADADRARRQY